MRKDQENMTLDEIEKITSSLYDVANKIVGNVGESTKISLSITCESYVEFAMTFTDKDKILDTWKGWIHVYKAFAKYNKPSASKVYHGQPLKIYWRQRPEIIEDSENQGQYMLYARLLISGGQESKLLYSPI